MNKIVLQMNACIMKRWKTKKNGTKYHLQRKTKVRFLHNKNSKNFAFIKPKSTEDVVRAIIFYT